MVSFFTTSLAQPDPTKGRPRYFSVYRTTVKVRLGGRVLPLTPLCRFCDWLSIKVPFFLLSSCCFVFSCILMKGPSNVDVKENKCA